MAKKSKVVKERKRREIVEKYAEIRRELKERGDFEALRKLPRDSSPTRLKNRCEVTGRPRGYLRNSKCLGLHLESMRIKDKYLVWKNLAGNKKNWRND